MIRVGVAADFSNNWIGGLNYLNSLLVALKNTQSIQIEVVLFASKKADPALLRKFQGLCQIEKLSVLTGWTPSWFLWKITRRLFSSDWILERELRKFGIQVISHSNTLKTRTLAAINWIPDFQHVHLPGMFEAAEIRGRNRSFQKMISHGDLVIVSSEAAYRDLADFSEPAVSKGRCLRFVVQPHGHNGSGEPESADSLFSRYSIDRPFFYIPNQFWKHKNHEVVFRAVQILRKEGIDFLVVCSGNTHDYRNPEYFQGLMQWVDAESSNIKILGIIEYRDVVALMKESVAVINPSFFEGWSTSVEECKVLGKRVILSNIPVHEEQDPPGGLFFDPKSPEELAMRMKEAMGMKSEPVASVDHRKLSEEFALQFQRIVREALEIRDGLFRKE